MRVAIRKPLKRRKKKCGDFKNYKKQINQRISKNEKWKFKNEKDEQKLKNKKRFKKRKFV